MPNETEPVAPSAPSTTQESKRILCGVLAIVVGWTGAHKFVLGYTIPGIIMLACALVGGVLTVFLCMPGLGTTAVWIVGLIEGIIYLTKTDDQFVQTYQVGKKEWF